MASTRPRGENPWKLESRFSNSQIRPSLLMRLLARTVSPFVGFTTLTPAMLHARLIRDADKLDNCRVKLEESMETLLDMDEKTVGASPISPKVWESCKAEESVLSADRKTGMDYWMSYLALYFDINFLETYQIIKEQDYIRRIAERVPYSREDTKEKVAYTVKKLEEKMNIQP